MKLRSTASTTKLESKRQETTETVEGMKGRKSNRGLTLSFMCFVMLYQCFCITVCSSEPTGSNWSYMLLQFCGFVALYQFWFSMILLLINVIWGTFVCTRVFSFRTFVVVRIFEGW